MSYTWQQFQDAVILQLTDKAPDNAGFTEAQAEYVRARIASELRGDKDGYAIHQNRYTALRRKLVGYETTLDAAAQRVAVRAIISDVAPDNTLFSLACSYWVKAHTVNEVNRAGEEAGGWMAMYRNLRNRLLGYSHSYANFGALRTAVNGYLAVDMTAENLGTFLDAQITAAVSDLQGLASWFNQQVAAAEADLESLHERVEREIRAATIIVQQHVEVYRKGQVSTFGPDDVTAQGEFAAIGVMPGQAAVREAWMLYPQADVDNASQCARRQCERVGWEERFDYMTCRAACGPMIAFDPYGQEFMVAPIPSGALLVVSGAGTAAVNGVYWAIGTVNDEQAFYLNRDIDSYSVTFSGTEWKIGIGGGEDYYTLGNNPPWDETWASGDGADPAPTVIQGSPGQLELRWDGLKLDFEAADETTLDESAVDTVAARVQLELARYFNDGVQAVRDLELKAQTRLRQAYIEGNRRKRLRRE